MRVNFGFASVFLMIALSLITILLTYCATLINSSVSLYSAAITNFKQLEIMESGLPQHIKADRSLNSCVTIHWKHLQSKRTRRFCGFFPWKQESIIPNYNYLQQQTQLCPSKSTGVSQWNSSVFTLFTCKTEKLEVSGKLLALHGDLEVSELHLRQSENQQARLYVSGNLRVKNLIVEGTVVIISGGKIEISQISNPTTPKIIFLHSGNNRLSLPVLDTLNGTILKQQIPSNWVGLPFQAFSIVPNWQEQS